MLPRRVLRAAALGWAVVGLLIGSAAFGHVDPDARLLVGTATVVLPAAAALASVALHRHRDRTAGFLLLLSVATPTYFAWILNVPALVASAVLLVKPLSFIRASTGPEGTPIR